VIPKIGLEEHCMLPEFVDYWLAAVRGMSDELIGLMLAQLNELGERRIELMDAAGIETAVLSVAGSVLLETDTASAIRIAAKGNDDLALAVGAHPGRLAGFATLPLQDPAAAAHELERCVRQLDFKVAMVFGHVHGRYLDEDRFAPIWECAQDLDVPIYLHPIGSYVMPHHYEGRPQLLGPVWNWTEETATHALRIIFGGVFDRYPSARLILGHMGETLPFMPWRLDSRYEFVNVGRGGAPSIEHLPSYYIRRNIAVTTAGVCSASALRCALDELGEDNVIFSTDYPFESLAEAAEFADTTPIAEHVRRKLCYDNASRILRLHRPRRSAPAETTYDGRQEMRLAVGA